MDQPAVRVESIGKRYRIGERTRGAYRTLRDALTDAATRQLRRMRAGRPPAATPEWIWAVRDVSFEVAHGEAVGVIGSNGAGKSTLLKLLSRITEPTEGRIEISGRVGSLLEVGTGFHLELTGRENIYLNGAILGMKKAEIDRKFDEIVAFSEISRFLDTPVKHYSSGMYVRLAFAVAAHLEPEVLLVDEVLAVGDAAFQKKCLGKMDDVAREGRTVLFVSHNMPSVQRLCPRCLWLSGGRIVGDGRSHEVVRAYLESLGALGPEAELPAAAGQPMRLRRARVWDGGEGASGVVEFSRPVVIEVDYDVNRPVTSCHVAVFVNSSEGICVLGSGDADMEPARLGPRRPGRYRGRVRIPPNLLGEGAYTVTVTMGVPYLDIYDRHESVVQFQVVDATSGRRRFQHRRRPGILGLELPWDVEELS